MTLKRRSTLFFLAMLVLVGAAVALFRDYHKLADDQVSSLMIAGDALSLAGDIQRSVRGGDPNRALTLARKARETLKALSRETLRAPELEHLMLVRLSFVRIERLLGGRAARGLTRGALLAQISNELKKVAESVSDFRRTLVRRVDRARARVQGRMALLLAAMVGLLGLGLVMFYRQLVQPVVDLSGQVQGIREGRLSEIRVRDRTDELGQLSRFTAETLAELRRNAEASQRRFEAQQMISRILRASQGAAKVDDFLQEVLDAILSLSWLCVQDKGAIFLVAEGQAEGEGVLALKTSRGLGARQLTRCRRVAFGYCLCGGAAASGQTIHKADVDQDHGPHEQGDHGHYCVPMRRGDRVLGVITLYLPSGYRADPAHVALLEDTAIIVADSLEMRRLAEREHQINLAIEQLGDGIAIADRELRIEHVNAAFERLSSRDRSTLVGHSLAHELSVAGLGQEDLERAAAGELVTAKVVRVLQGLQERHEQVSMIAVGERGGEQTHVVCIRRDITKEVTLEQQLSRAQKMEVVGRLSGGVAHDFNNCLTAIIGFSTDALRAARKGSVAIAELEDVLDAARRAARITKQLLAFSRGQVIQPHPLDLRQTLDGMESMLRTLVGDRIVLEIVVDPGLWAMTADETQIERAVVNLVVNAADAMNRGGVLQIEARNEAVGDDGGADGLTPGEYVLLAVSDTGCGMSPEVEAHIFEPFFTTKGMGQGTGLGLAMVYALTQQTNGHVRVSTEVGKGSSFQLYFPRTVPVEPAAERNEARPLPSASGQSEVILVVEDQDLVRRLVVGTLQRAGYRVIQAADGSAGIAQWRQHRGEIDFIVTDVMMPVMTGPEMLDQIWQDDPSMRALCMSGYAEQENLDGLNAGRVDMIAKPVSGSQLASAVRAALDKQGAVAVGVTTD